MLIDNPRGNYSFLKGIAPYSAGAVASKARNRTCALHPVVPLRAGFDVVSAHLKSIGAPRQALCGWSCARRGRSHLKVSASSTQAI